MKSKELLFELIHSLTKSEKRYFKVFTSNQKENNNYVKIFNAIQTQKTYNEKELLVKFKNEDFVNQFSVAKNYLLNLILKSLSNHHQKAKKSIELNALLTEIEILYWKGLYKLAYKKVNQAKKTAKKYHMAHYLLLINYWDKRLEDHTSSQMLSESASKETAVYLKDYNQEMQMTLLIKEMQKITRSTIKTTSQTAHPVKKIFNHELMQLKESEIKNFYTKVDYYFLKGVGYALLSNKKEEFKYKMKLLKYLEENPHQIKENPLRYSSALNNILLYYYFQGYPKEYPEYLAKLDNVDLKFHHAKAAFYDTKYNLAIGYYLHLRDNDKIQATLSEMEEWYSSTASLKGIQAKMICEYNMALAYFYLKKTKKSLRWCNSSLLLFDMKAKKFRHDLAVSTLLIQIFIYIDLGYFELASRALENVMAIAKKNKYKKAEISIFNLLKNILNEEKIAVGIDKVNKIIKQESAAFINLDQDVIIYWLEQKGI